MEQKKIDEITSIRYVGIEPSFKMYYNMVLVCFGELGFHHLALKDIKGFIFHWILLIIAVVLMLLGSFVGSVVFVLGVLVGIFVLVVTWIIPVLVAFYHYVDDDYFEMIKGKSTWALKNRLLLVVPKP